jgi:uncharacterized protein (TIGR00251 family)
MALFPTVASSTILRLMSVTPNLPSYLRSQPDGVLLSVKLQPRASANEICEPLGDELRIKVTAPPVDSAANEALVRFLADRLNCPRNRIELLRGATSRHKVIKLHGLKVEEVAKGLGFGTRDS